MTKLNSGPQPISNDLSSGTLKVHLQAALEEVDPEKVAIATAYLTPDGFLAIKDQLLGAESVRILLGERPFLNRRGPADKLGQPSDDDDLAGAGEAIDWYGFLEGNYPWLLLNQAERRALIAEHPDSPEMVGLRNFDAWNRVRQLADFLERDGVQVRRYLDAYAGKTPPGMVLSHKTASKIRLHAKAYLFSRPERGWAAVGSSNLTGKGLTENIELNLATADLELVRTLEDWFDNKWQGGQDCRQEFIDLLEECVLFGPRFKPWHVFIKALDAAYGRFLDFSLSGDIAAKLANFQQEAVVRCLELMERHWGAMLCDSVGLGKTHEGLGVLAEFSRRRYEADAKRPRALIICPAQLLPNWSDEKLETHEIRGKAISMESLVQLVPDPDEEANETAHQRNQRLALLRDYQNADVILVDESHNFRNPATKRYQALMEIIRGGRNPDKRVLLMTATPINNGPWDLYHQLALITRGDDGWYAGRGPIANLRNTFRAIEKGGGATGLLDTMLLSLVRRTRHDIRAMQEAGQPADLNGEPLKFPEHQIPKAIAYSLSELYGRIYNEVLETITSLHFAVYNLEAYGVVTEEAEKTTDKTVQARNKTFIGIMRTILLKRMESSVVSLTATVRTMVDYLDLFLRELDQNNRVITPKDAARLRTALGGSLPDDALDDERNEQRLRRRGGATTAPPADPKQRERLVAEVQEDREWLNLLLVQLEARQREWENAEDPKLTALRNRLESLPPYDRHGVPTKVVIFTNYKDTADYIFQGLGDGKSGPGAPHRWKSNLRGGQWISKLTGADNRERRNEVLSYFAPLAAFRTDESPDDSDLIATIAPFRDAGIDILIATDVLSEGQNLQDAQYLINYDLHWNPVKMIQRAGRIDRLFSPHEQIFIYNIMPEQELESLLKLVNRLAEKVASIEEMIGLDASVLGEQIEHKAFDRIMKLVAGGKQAEEVYREGEESQGLDDAFAELNTYVQMVKEIGTEEVKKVPDGIYSVRLGREAGVFIMLRMPEEASGEVFWRFYPFNRPDPVSIPSEVLKLIETTREEDRVEIGDDTSPFRYLGKPLSMAVEQIGDEYKRHMAEKTQDDFTRRLNQFLQRDDVLLAEPDLFDRLNSWRQNSPPSSALNRPGVREAVRAVRVTRANAPAAEVITVLTALMEGLEREGLDRPVQRPPSREPSERELELVCWELIVTKEMLGMAGLPEPERWGAEPNATLPLPLG